MKYLLSFLIVALGLYIFGNYQPIAKLNFICGRVMGVVDGEHQSTATEAAKFRLGTMTDVCSIIGWDWGESRPCALVPE